MTLVRSGARGAAAEDVFRGLYAEHYGAVYAYCARRLGSDDATDAAAEVFTVAWRRIWRVPSDEGALPWLYGVARNIVANHRRSRRRRQRLEARLATHPAPVWTEVPAGHDGVLASLRDDDCEILMLAAWEGLGSEDLGRALGCSASAASVRLHRARNRLSAAWDSAGGGR